MVDHPRQLSQARTPAAVLDVDKLTFNCERMRSRCDALGVGLRPHLKTLKSLHAARLAVDPKHGGIAVATLNEAVYFAEGGFTDIQYAVCIAPDKIPSAANLLDRTPKFSFFLDSMEVARAVAAAERPRHAQLRAWIEIDCGDHRTGLEPDSATILAIAETLVMGDAILEGVATHAGQAYQCYDVSSIARTAEEERSAVVFAAERLRKAGFACVGVSAGSTPTAAFCRSTTGLTELRAGVYMAGDLFQQELGAVSNEDLAFSVLATVIGHNMDRNQIIVDAGGLALSKDRSTAVLSGRDKEYGLVTDLNGMRIFGDLLVHEVHQEHGKIVGGLRRLPFEKLAIGTKIRIFPNHVCMTAAMYDHYLVVKNGQSIVDTWPRTNGWN